MGSERCVAMYVLFIKLNLRSCDAGLAQELVQEFVALTLGSHTDHYTLVKRVLSCGAWQLELDAPSHIQRAPILAFNKILIKVILKCNLSYAGG